MRVVLLLVLLSTPAAAADCHELLERITSAKKEVDLALGALDAAAESEKDRAEGRLTKAVAQLDSLRKTYAKECPSQKKTPHGGDKADTQSRPG